MDTQKIAAFIAAAEAGSLSRAAERLGARLSTVSRQVADLERELGARLLTRTGRGVRTTPAGELFLERARRVLRELEAASAEVRADGAPAMKDLRLSSPPDLARHLLPAVLDALCRRHPTLSVESRAESRRVSVIEESYDAVIRLGPLEPSDLLARSLGSVTLCVCLSPEVSCGGLEALAAMEYVLVDSVPSEIPATLNGLPVRLPIAGRLRLATFGEAAEMAAISLRAAILPSFAAGPWLAAGDLVRVLPELLLPRVEVWLLTPQRHRYAPVMADLAELVASAIAGVERRL